MFKIAICDDEQVISCQIENILLLYSEIVCLKMDITIFNSGKALYEYIQSGSSFQLIYLDIEMKGMDGIEVGKKIRNTIKDHKVEIVYISGKVGYDRQLFGVQPLHFIPKPINSTMVTEVLKLAILRRRILEDIFTYKKAGAVHKVLIKDIIYFESIARTIKIVTINNTDVFYGTMQEVDELVKAYQFIRIHRSYIINYDHIHILKYDEVIMSNGLRLSISQSRRKEVRDRQLSMEQGE